MSVGHSFAIDLATYRSRPDEQRRVDSLLSLLPDRAARVLEVGARDGHITRLLRQRYDCVVAFDLRPVRLEEPGCHALVADLAALPFPDESFDAVLCPEVLEHLPPVHLASACRELVRVTSRTLVVGVPFEQDLRIGRTTCPSCGERNPPWAHHSSFTRARLLELLAPLRPVAEDHVGVQRAVTNALSMWILDRCGNPWGTYEQEEPCVRCGTRLAAPTLGATRWLAAKSAVALQRAQGLLASARPAWIHLALAKRAG